LATLGSPIFETTQTLKGLRPISEDVATPSELRKTNVHLNPRVSKQTLGLELTNAFGVKLNLTSHLGELCFQNLLWYFIVK